MLWHRHQKAIISFYADAEKGFERISDLFIIFQQVLLCMSFSCRLSRCNSICSEPLSLAAGGRFPGGGSDDRSHSERFFRGNSACAIFHFQNNNGIISAAETGIEIRVQKVSTQRYRKSSYLFELEFSHL